MFTIMIFFVIFLKEALFICSYIHIKLSVFYVVENLIFNRNELAVIISDKAVDKLLSGFILRFRFPQKHF